MRCISSLSHRFHYHHYHYHKPLVTTTHTHSYHLHYCYHHYHYHLYPPHCAVSACGGEWSVAGCQVRLAQCSPITRALTGPAGPVTSVLACLALSALPANPTPDFFMSIGG